MYKKKISIKTTERSDKNGPAINEIGNNIIKKFDIFKRKSLFIIMNKL